MLVDIEQQVSAYLPHMTGLQQFIAINPLEGLIQHDFFQATQHLYQRTGVSPWQPLQAYYHHYHDGRITHRDLRAAIAEQLTQDPLTSQFDDTQRMQAIDCMLSFITSLDPTSCSAPKICTKQLIAYTARAYYFDDPVSHIRLSIYRFITAFFHTPLAKDMHFTAPGFNRWASLMRQKNPAWASLLANLPADTADLIELVRTRLCIPTQLWSQYLFEIAWEVKGWLGYLQHKKLDEHFVNETLSLDSVWAMWLCEELYWLMHEAPYQPLPRPWPFHAAETMPTHSVTVLSENWQAHLCDIPHLPAALQDYPWDYWRIAAIWQRAYEWHFCHQLQGQLTTPHAALVATTPQAQWVFCIDPRSEYLRTAIEAFPEQQTIGFAGFFGFAFCYTHQQNTQAQCPALMQADLILHAAELETLHAGLNDLFSQSIQAAKSHLLTPFTLFELLGLWKSFTLLINNFIGRKTSATNTHGTPALNALIAMDSDHPQFADYLSQAQQFLHCLNLPQLAETIILCGHGAKTVNNPYHSALNCGACGGNSGLLNALVACAILNNSAIRVALAQQGDVIPTQTRFIAALHETTSDTILWADDSNAESRLTALKDIAEQAATNCRLRREQLRPDQDERYHKRCEQWAEIYPELGLVNNAAMIIGPRALSQSHDLKGRVFLHDYQYERDTEGKILRQLMLAPMVVAQWITMQYYFSSVAPAEYSAGNKALHNVLPQVGVMEGNFSDLKIGLPYQSLYYQDICLHEAMRLQVFIAAPDALIQHIIATEPYLQQLVAGQWLHVIAITATGKPEEM